MKTLLLALGGVLFFYGVVGAETVMITSARPIEKLDASGHPEAVSGATVGTTYSLIRQDGDNLILKADDGGEYLISVGATNYSPPAPTLSAETNSPPAGENPVPTSPAVAQSPAAPAAPPVSGSPAAADLPATTTPSVGPGATTAASAAPPSTGVTLASGLSPDDADKIKQIDDALGLPLLGDGAFWQDDIEQVAQRLSWPMESKTTTQESYRRYAIKQPAMILGVPAYSLALYGKNGKPTYISLIFSNAGDFPQARQLSGSDLWDDPDRQAAVMAQLAIAVKHDAETITATLTPLLGRPSVTLYGNSASNREEVHRWDWKDVAFLLDAHHGEYASVRIIPAEAADHFGTVAVTDREEMKALLAQRVVKRANGDVVLSEIPMVDQGPKGYCVPATWERYLRYLDVPADLYVLAIMGQTGFRGTNPVLMEAGVNDYVRAYHRRIEDYDGPLDIPHISRYIDQGLPLMWGCWIDRGVEIQSIKNTRERKTVTDWGAYTKALEEQDRAWGEGTGRDPAGRNGHERLIIGYNATTNEIAISDSWGAAFAERWMYVPTAVKISAGRLGYVSW